MSDAGARQGGGEAAGADGSAQPAKVLVVVAHPDDIDFGGAATIARWISDGADVTYCIVTDGDSGGSDRSQSRADMASVRRREQVAAAAVVGVDDVRFLGYPDGKLYSSLGLRRDISRVIRQVRPDRVVTQSPEHNWERLPASHPDHRAVGDATLDAIYPDARNPFAHPELLEEGLEPHIVEQVWVMASVHPTHWVDVTATFDLKIRALSCHVSQVAHMEDLAGFVQSRLTASARAGGLPDGHLAEEFLVVRAPR